MTTHLVGREPGLNRARELVADTTDRATTLGAAPWIARCDSELGRLGLRREPGDQLTPSERRIAELAATGRTNREVAAAVFVSAKTVEATLARAYRKLGIHSRAELGRRMAEQHSAGGAPPESPPA